MLIAGYLVTGLVIFFCLVGMIGIPLSLFMPFGAIMFIITPLIAYWIIDWIWVAIGIGPLPLSLLIFGFIWPPIYNKIAGSRLTDSGRSSLYGSGWAALIFGAAKFFIDDPVRWM